MITETPRILDISVPWRSLNELGTNFDAGGTSTIYYGMAGEAQLSEEDRLSPGFTPLKLGPYFGPCFVLDMPNASTEIDAKHLSDLISPLEDNAPNGTLPARLLLRTGFKKNDSDTTIYPCLTADALLYLEAKAIVLFGIDCPSIDKADGNPMNAVFMKTRRMVWLINIDLTGVESGLPYMLSALPLLPEKQGRMPARAVLIQMATDF